MSVYKLSRCNGSRTCWQATVGDSDYCAGTNYDLGRLVESLWERDRAHGESPSFVLHVSEEGEEAAREVRAEAERKRLEDATKAAQATIRESKKRLAELDGAESAHA